MGKSLFCLVILHHTNTFTDSMRISVTLCLFKVNKYLRHWDDFNANLNHFEYNILMAVHSNCTDMKPKLDFLSHKVDLWPQGCNVLIWNLLQIVCDWLGICYCTLEIWIQCQSGYHEFGGFSRDPTKFPLIHLHFWIFASFQHFQQYIGPDPKIIIFC